MNKFYYIIFSMSKKMAIKSHFSIFLAFFTKKICFLELKRMLKLLIFATFSYNEHKF